MNVDIPRDVLNVLHTDDKGSLMASVHPQMKDPQANPMFSNPSDVMQDTIAVEDVQAKKDILSVEDND